MTATWRGAACASAGAPRQGATVARSRLRTRQAPGASVTAYSAPRSATSATLALSEAALPAASVRSRPSRPPGWLANSRHCGAPPRASAAL